MNAQPLNQAGASRPVEHGGNPNPFLFLGGLAGLGVVGFLATRYRIAYSNEYLVRTGLFIQDIAIDKKAFHLPFQTISRISLAPKSYSFHIHAMSNEKNGVLPPSSFHRRTSR